MSVFRTIAAAFSLFSKLPVPGVKWDAGSMRYMLCAFPLVGVLSGAALCLWFWLCGALNFGDMLFAAGVTLIPVAVTGGIHLDGFCDTADALASRASPERRREILKDPHAGAFAIIALSAYLLLYFAVATELSRDTGAALLIGLGYVLCRTLSGLSVICFPSSANEGLVFSFRKQSAKSRAALTLLIEFTLAAAAMIWYFWPGGTFMVFAALLCLVWLRLTLKRFGGMSGDLAGWFLQIAELTALIALVAAQKLVP